MLLRQEHDTGLRTIRVARRVWVALLTAGWILLAQGPLASSAQAQITVDRLIGDSVSDVNSTRYAVISDAIKYFLNRDVIGARTFLDQARRNDPTLPPTDVTLAKMYYMTNNAAGGRVALEQAVAESPGDPEAYLLLGEQALAQGGTIEAEALFDKALELTAQFDENPKRKRDFGIRAHWGRALVAERRKNWQSMAADLQELLKIDDKHARARYRLGMALCQQEQFEQGFNEFVKAQQEDESMPNPALALALMYDRFGSQYADRVRRAFGQALNTNKNDLNTMANYAQWLIKSGALEEAENQLSVARKGHPDSVDILVLSGVNARMRGEMDEAEAYFVAAQGKSPAHPGVINQLAQVLIEQDDEAKKSRALAWALMNSRLNSESADAQVTLAWVYFRLGRANEFVNALRKAGQMGNMNSDSRYLVAKMLASLNKTEQTEAAKRILTEALENGDAGIFIYQREAQQLQNELNNRTGN